MTVKALLADGVFDGEAIRRNTALLLEGDRVVDLVPRDAVRDDEVETLPPGTLLAPGFIDVQVNGGGGVLLNDHPTVEGIRTIAEAHRGFGTTGLLPTLISDTREKIRQAIEAVAAALDKGVPGVLGIHLEGPFINVARKGVHPPGHIVEATTADLDLLAGLGARGLTLVTLAPECVPPGFVAELVRRGVIVCAGHTDATAAQAAAAVREGLSGFTHLFNAMSQLGSREPGTVGAALTSEGTFAGIIPDGHHVADLSLRLAWKAAGPERLMLVSDAMSTVGTDMREFSLFGRRILVGEGRCTTEDGTLAGAHLDMAGAVRHMTALIGVPLEQAFAMASRTPARFLGLFPDRGRLAPGARADIVALRPDLTVLGTWIGGEYQGTAPG